VEQHDSVLEASLDDGDMRANGHEASVCELEIEIVRGEPGAAFKAARKLADQVPLRLGVLSKAERGFALADGALAKPSKAGPVPVRAGMTVAEGFSVIAQSCLRHFRLNEPLVIENRDPAALHQSRVAMRRLRAALSIFRPALVERQFEHLRDDLHWFTGQLGDARNLDVYLEQGTFSRSERKALRKEREHAYDRVIDALKSKRFRILMIDLIAWLALGRWRTNDKARRPLVDYAARRIDRLWQKIAGHDDLASMEDEERHDLRIEIKKLRYALEFVQPLHAHSGRKQKQFSKAVEGLQEALGDLNDLVTARTIGERFGVADALSDDEARKLAAECLGEAQSSLDRLRKIGPYWRKSA
jgi:triphosphatase